MLSAYCRGITPTPGWNAISQGRVCVKDCSKDIDSFTSYDIQSECAHHVNDIHDVVTIPKTVGGMAKTSSISCVFQLSGTSFGSLKESLPAIVMPLRIPNFFQYDSNVAVRCDTIAPLTFSRKSRWPTSDHRSDVDMTAALWVKFLKPVWGPGNSVCLACRRWRRYSRGCVASIFPSTDASLAGCLRTTTTTTV